MSELRIPLDVEQLAETSQLRALLRALLRNQRPAPGANPGREVEAVAAFLFQRLFVVLGYLARSTNKPGRLNAAGAGQLRESVDALFGDDVDVLQLLVTAGLLVLEGTEWYCPLFARLNEHLAGDYRPVHQRGNDGRQVTIAIQHATAALPFQLKMLIPENCQRVAPDGTRTPFDPQELDRVVMLISSLDKVFKFARHRTQFTESLLNDAAKACALFGYTSKLVPESLRSFIGWLIGHRDHPRVPGTTDQLLQDFELILALSK